MSKKEKLASVEECLARSDEIMIKKRPSLLQRVNAGIILGQAFRKEPNNPQVLVRLAKVHYDNPEACLPYIKRLAGLPNSTENKKYIDAGKKCLQMMKDDNLIN